MPSIIVRMRKDYAVYWPFSSYDSFGVPVLGTPEEIRCRWDDEVTSQLLPTGEPVTSRATVYVPEAVVVGGYLFHGRLVDIPASPQSSEKVFRIVKTKDYPNLKYTEHLHIAYV